MISFMSDFNKGNFPPPRKKKETYKTVVYQLTKDGKYIPNYKLENTVNSFAMAGYDLDSITPLNGGREVLLVFKRSTRLS